MASLTTFTHSKRAPFSSRFPGLEEHDVLNASIVRTNTALGIEPLDEISAHSTQSRQMFQLTHFVESVDDLVDQRYQLQTSREQQTKTLISTRRSQSIGGTRGSHAMSGISIGAAPYVLITRSSRAFFYRRDTQHFAQLRFRAENDIGNRGPGKNSWQERVARGDDTRQRMISSCTDRERALRGLEKREKTCLVSASLLTAIRLEHEVNET